MPRRLPLSLGGAGLGVRFSSGFAEPDAPFTISMEAMNRMNSMKRLGEQHVVYDRAGNKRPLIGPEAVDYNPRPGETYGVEGPQGFRLLNDQGGKVPRILK